MEPEFGIVIAWGSGEDGFVAPPKVVLIPPLLFTEELKTIFLSPVDRNDGIGVDACALRSNGVASLSHLRLLWWDIGCLLFV